MKCKGKFFNLCAFLLIALVAVNISLTATDKAVTHPELNKGGFYCLPSSDPAPALPSEMIKNSLRAETSNPMDRIFQIIFILFFISPPLIVLLLFLIWCELRKRNEHK